MAGVNKVILVGNLGNDPDVRYTQSGDAIANISIATSDTWKDKNTGQQQEKTEWHKVVLYKRLGEIAGQYLKKGSKVYIEGKLQTRKWQDQSGQDRYTTEIKALEMQMLDSREPGQNQQYQGGQNTPHNPPSPQRGGRAGSGGAQPRQQNAPPSNTDFDDDIPF